MKINFIKNKYLVKYRWTDVLFTSQEEPQNCVSNES